MGAFTVRVSNISDYWEVRDEDGDLVADYVPASDIAKLFAAAPELLAAMKDLLDQMHAIGLPDWHGAEGLCFDRANAAIAKAEGGGAWV